MSELLPSNSGASADQPGELQTLWLDSEEAGDLLSSLASETARSVLTALHDEPMTASEVAERVDTSLQNARHHLNNLQEAGLVRIADTRYSSKGREMNVYAPGENPMVVFVGRESRKTGMLDSLRQLMPAVGVLALASLLVQYLVTASIGGASVAGELPRIGDSLGGPGGIAPVALPPGLIFLVGGLLALTVAFAVRETWT